MDPFEKIHQAVIHSYRAGMAAVQPHPLDVARERRQAAERDEERRRMGYTPTEIAVRKEDPRRWTRAHPGPGMRRVILQWPDGKLDECSVCMDNSWKWSTADVLMVREEA